MRDQPIYKVSTYTGKELKAIDSVLHPCHDQDSNPVFERSKTVRALDVPKCYHLVEAHVAGGEACEL
jgi:hypothetical protein